MNRDRAMRMRKSIDFIHPSGWNTIIAFILSNIMNKLIFYYREDAETHECISLIYKEG
jgi:hypothetical protein